MLLGATASGKTGTAREHFQCVTDSLREKPGAQFPLRNESGCLTECHVQRAAINLVIVGDSQALRVPTLWKATGSDVTASLPNL